MPKGNPKRLGPWSSIFPTSAAEAQETAARQQQRQRRRSRGEANEQADQFLRPISTGEYQELQDLTWKDYLAHRALKEALQRIGEDLIPEKLEQRRASRQKLFESADVQPPGIPIVLFEGPPGTGKTFGMKAQWWRASASAACTFGRRKRAWRLQDACKEKGRERGADFGCLGCDIADGGDLRRRLHYWMCSSTSPRREL